MATSLAFLLIILAEAYAIDYLRIGPKYPVDMENLTIAFYSETFEREFKLDLMRIERPKNALFSSVYEGMERGGNNRAEGILTPLGFFRGFIYGPTGTFVIDDPESMLIFSEIVARGMPDSVFYNENELVKEEMRAMSNEDNEVMRAISNEDYEVMRAMSNKDNEALERQKEMASKDFILPKQQKQQQGGGNQEDQGKTNLILPKRSRDECGTCSVVIYVSWKFWNMSPQRSFPWFRNHAQRALMRTNRFLKFNGMSCVNFKLQDVKFYLACSRPGFPDMCKFESGGDNLNSSYLLGNFSDFDHSSACLAGFYDYRPGLDVAGLANLGTPQYKDGGICGTPNNTFLINFSAPSLTRSISLTRAIPNLYRSQAHEMLHSLGSWHDVSTRPGMENLMHPVDFSLPTEEILHTRHRTYYVVDISTQSLKNITNVIKQRKGCLVP